ncbi:hypothetical protein Tco_0735439 [Tanacetum coccineum]
MGVSSNENPSYGKGDEEDMRTENFLGYNHAIVGIKSLFEVTAAKYKVNASEGVNAASDEVSTAELEVMENGNTAPKTTVVEGVKKVIPPTTAKEKA